MKSYCIFAVRGEYYRIFADKMLLYLRSARWKLPYLRSELRIRGYCIFAARGEILPYLRSWLRIRGYCIFAVRGENYRIFADERLLYLRSARWKLPYLRRWEGSVSSQRAVNTTVSSQMTAIKAVFRLFVRYKIQIHDSFSNYLYRLILYPYPGANVSEKYERSRIHFFDFVSFKFFSILLVSKMQF